MRNSIALAFCVLLACGPARAAAPDPELKKFIATFAAALTAKTSDPAAKLAHFPIRNAVYREGETISQREFKQHFQTIKIDQFVTCLKATAPKPSAKENKRLGEYFVDCDGNTFYFAKFDGAWRYSGFENVNE